MPPNFLSLAQNVFTARRVAGITSNAERVNIPELIMLLPESYPS